MYLKSRFKSLPSVFLEVAIYSGLGSPPPHYYAGYFPYYRNG